MERVRFLSKMAVSMLFLVLLPTSLVVGQSRVGCVQSLNKAQRLYEQGELQQTISTIGGCTEGNYLEQTQRIEAFRLIVLSYLFLDQQKEAESYYRKLLRTDPNYVPSASTEPVELVQLHNRFQTHPITSVGVLLGGNLSRPQILSSTREIFRADGLRESDRVARSSLGSQIGIMGEIQPLNNVSIHSKLLFVTLKNRFEESLFGGDQLNFEESQSWFELPISVRYYFGKRNKVRFYAEAGLAGRLLSRSEASVQRLVQLGQDVTGPDIDISSARRQTNYAYLFGFGLRRSLGHVLLHVEVSTRYDINQQVNEKKRYSNSELLFLYGYVDEDFKTLVPSISVGISYAIYRHAIKKKRRE